MQRWMGLEHELKVMENGWGESRARNEASGVILCVVKLRGLSGGWEAE